MKLRNFLILSLCVASLPLSAGQDPTSPTAKFATDKAATVKNEAQGQGNQRAVERKALRKPDKPVRLEAFKRLPEQASARAEEVTKEKVLQLEEAKVEATVNPQAPAPLATETE